MKAARLHAYRTPFVIEDVPEPEPRTSQVVVRVEAAGFCHSDLHVADGEIPVLPRMPVTLGHENAGTVAAVGDGVTAVRVGDRVAVHGAWGCGHCDWCVTGRDQLCAIPSWAGLSAYDGGYAEYLLVPSERYLVRLETLEPKLAAPLTDAALTPYRAVKRALPYLEPDHAVTVIGVGGLGQFAVKLLRLMTGAEIIAVDIDDDKLAIAGDYGATHLLDGRDPDIAASIRKIAPGGVSASFDVVGADATLALALATTRQGGKVTQIGLAGGTARLKVLETVGFEVLFEATLWGTVKELREVVALAESGRLTPVELEFAPLDEIEAVRARLRSGAVRGRAVIVP